MRTQARHATEAISTAIVIISPSEAFESSTARWQAMAPLLDRPFVQHVVESILDQGIREIDFVLGKELPTVRGALADGSRWGGRFRYHSVASPSDAYAALKRIQTGPLQERVLLGHADRLPTLNLRDPALAFSRVLFCCRESITTWAGWAVLYSADLAGIPECADEDELLDFLLSLGSDLKRIEVPKPLAARSHADLIDSNRRVLARDHPGLLVAGREVRPGLWIARNVNVHASATLVPPAFLGENCRVGAQSQVGPAASIGKDCMIDRETRISDSIVCQGTYVGERLLLNGVFVDRSRLVNTRLGADIDGVDELLLGSVADETWKTRAGRVWRRLFAAMALIAALPILGLVAVGSWLGFFPTWQKRLIVRTPAVADPCRWRAFTLWTWGGTPRLDCPGGWLRHFLLYLLPALAQAALGRMDFVGPQPRTKHELRELPPLERFLCLRSRPGILSPHEWWRLSGESDPSEVEAGWRYDIALMTGYAGRVLRDCLFLRKHKG